MLEAIGLDHLTETLYRAMLERPHDGVAELSVQLKRPVEDIRRGLDQLSSLALIRAPAGGEPSGFRTVSPETAMEYLLARQQADLAAQQMRVEESRVAAARLIAEYSSLRPGAGDGESEYLVGVEAIRDRLAALGRQVGTEVMTLAPGGAHSAEDLRASRGPNAELLDRGVRIRTVYLHSVRNDQPTLDHVTWLAEHGGRVRTATSLPIRMIVLDRRQAVLPLDTDDARSGAVVVRRAGILTALCALFENIWASATPLGDERPPEARGVDDQAAEVLRLLATGLTDEAVAKRLGVSARTARRITADLMRRLDARSRFEAGVHAVQDGWLPSTR